MATGMSEVYDTPPLKRRKSIENADTHTTRSPSARTWVQTFNRLFPPFFGVPGFTSPNPSPTQQNAVASQQKFVTPHQKVIPPKQSVGFKHVFGGGIKAPVFTFTPHGNQKLFPNFRSALRGPQLPAKEPPATPVNGMPNHAAELDGSVTGGTSEKLRRICAFFTKPTSVAALVPSPSGRPNPTTQPAPLAQTVSPAQSFQAVHTLASTQSVVPGSRPTPAAPSVHPVPRSAPPAQTTPPASRRRIIHASGGLITYRNIDTGEVRTVGPSGKTSVRAPAQVPTYHPATQSTGPWSNAQPPQNAACATGAPLHAPLATAAISQSVVPVPVGRPPPPSQFTQPNGMMTRSQSAAKRSHAEFMAGVPREPRHGTRAQRQIATAVAKLHRLSLDDPVFLDAVEVVQDFTDYRFNSHAYVREALHAQRVPISIGDRICLQGNQRLAMLGDSLLRLAILEEWQGRVQYCRETENEGSRLWSNASLFRIGRLHGVDDLLCSVSDSQFMRPGVEMVATAMEAILGAIWLDSGKSIAIVKRVVRLWFGDDLD
ncbi:hypothetical protein DOTSEDRAFT_36487 [Dothistroma septosporum NZE10]|uniref:RNase III domain-containing protein n=1 Tax=Dothistroma septosporum (strain NZE10 / CBS 128990) TaxID=675120 RepID=N1PMG1_DOTSN|nr:hypothetical protein DOTSEDRAFT_36487 [Dothistroma septosporum NZE10]